MNIDEAIERLNNLGTGRLLSGTVEAEAIGVVVAEFSRLSLKVEEDRQSRHDEANRANTMVMRLSAEVERLRRALALPEGHEEREGLREAIRSEMIVLGLKQADLIEQLRAEVERLKNSLAIHAPKRHPSDGGW